VRLEPGTTKNRDGREFYFSMLPPLGDLLREQREHAERVQRETKAIVPWVFFRHLRSLNEARPIRKFEKAWRNAVRAAGVPSRLFHDLRRSAVRNLELSGVSRSVSMKLTGHKTETVYRRYAIASAADLREGVTKLARHHEQQSSAPVVVLLDRKARS